MNHSNSLALEHLAKPIGTQEALTIAQTVLLKPNGLSHSDLDELFGVMYAHRLDDADLYFQHTRSEQWSLEEGIVKSGSFSIDQGVGIRAISGDKTAFAYSDVIGHEALLKAAHATRVIGPKGGRVKVRNLLSARDQTSISLYGPLNPLESLTPQKKLRCLSKLKNALELEIPALFR